VLQKTFDKDLKTPRPLDSFASMSVELERLESAAYNGVLLKILL